MFAFIFLFRYSLHPPTQSIPSFTANLQITLCIEGSCQYISVLEGHLLSAHSCNGDMLLPGDGTINGLLAELGSNVGEAGKMLLLNSFGLTVSC